MKKLLIVNNPKDWNFDIPGVDVVSAKAYIVDPLFSELENVRVFNLCKQYRYQSTGYYVSLLAEARGHKVIPSVTTIQDSKSLAITKALTYEIDDLVQSSLRKLKSKDFTLSIYFGRNLAKQYDELARALFNLIPVPLLRAEFKHNKKWEITNMSPIPVNAIPEGHRAYLMAYAKEYFSKKRYASTKRSRSVYDLAILVNPEEKDPPSDKKALDRFVEVAEDLGFNVDMITKNDYTHIGEYDALFIRETTAVDHHTYRFARRAAAEGLVVIDDPLSILRCTNKVYLAELLAQAKVPMPKTIIIHKDNREMVKPILGLPCVLKKPDSSFSRGVIKVSESEELDRTLTELLDDSDLIIGQEFLPTDFDWRIGVLDRRPLFACKYFMAKGHWQIYNWNAITRDQEGAHETMPIDAVPPEVVRTALRACQQIGDGFYGVDLKELNGKIYVVEINDNPSIDYGCEDLVLKDELYRTVMKTILHRLEQSKKIKEGPREKPAPSV